MKSVLKTLTESSSRFRGAILSIFLTGIVLILLYGDILSEPGNFLFATKGDGLTNYFNFAWHIGHGSSFREFQGMNYPFGESILFLDMQPLSATLLKGANQLFPEISHKAIHILNFSMIASLLLCALFLFFIMESFGLQMISSVAGAVSITFLSSQVLLWEFGHYALSYTFFFPAGWYLYILYLKTEYKTRYSFLIMIHTILWFYIHNYLGMILLSFTFISQFLHYLIQFRTRIADIQWYFQTFIQSIVPGLTVLIIMRWLDHHEGRIEMPYLPQYRSDIYSVFFPLHSWTRNFIELIVEMPSVDELPWRKVGSYPGISTLLVLAVSIGVVLVKVVKGESRNIKTYFPAGLLAFILSAIILLMFSMAFPFRHGLEYLLPDFAKQFVSMGRFAWPFFYVACVFGFITISNLFKGRIEYLLTLLSSLLLFSEGMSNHIYLKDHIRQPNIVFQTGTDSPLSESDLKKIDAESFQAFLPLPFYYGYICLQPYKGTYESEVLSFFLSYKTGIPLIASSAARNSISEAGEICALFKPDHYSKEIIPRFAQKDILVTWTGQSLNEHEEMILNRSNYLYKINGISFYSLSPHDLLSYDVPSDIAFACGNADSLHRDTVSGLYHTSIDSVEIVFQSFDQQMNDTTLRGSGSFHGRKSAFNSVFKSERGNLRWGRKYEVSFWYYNHLFDQSFNSIFFETKDSNGHTIERIQIDPIRSFIYDGDWALHRFEFLCHPGTDHVSITSEGLALYSDEIYLDEILIRPVDLDVYNLASDSIVVKNNEEYPCRPTSRIQK